jgi:large subunit ribosomal protein L22
MGKRSAPPKQAENESRAVLRLLRVSPYKLNLVAQSIRGLSAEKAKNELRFSRKRISKDVLKCLQSAIDNAENNHSLDIDELIVAQAHVGKNIVMRRMVPRARGRGVRIEKHFSQVTIVLRDKSKQVEKPDQTAEAA